MVGKVGGGGGGGFGGRERKRSLGARGGSGLEIAGGVVVPRRLDCRHVGVPVLTCCLSVGRSVIAGWSAVFLVGCFFVFLV